jgi:hypothetical protein
VVELSVLTAAATWVELEVSVDPVVVNLSVVVLVDLVELPVLTPAAIWVELEVGVDRMVSVVALVDIMELSVLTVTLVVLEVVLRMVEVEETRPRLCML